MNNSARGKRNQAYGKAAEREVCRILNKYEPHPERYKWRRSSAVQAGGQIGDIIRYPVPHPTWYMEVQSRAENWPLRLWAEPELVASRFLEQQRRCPHDKRLVFHVKFKGAGWHSLWLSPVTDLPICNPSWRFRMNSQRQLCCASTIGWAERYLRAGE